jgi:hypothetical protein
MPDDAQRRFLFWSVCIPVRVAIAVATLVVGYLVPRWLPLVAVYATATAHGFAYNAALTLAGRKTHGGLGGLVWWADVRWVHIATWSATAALAFARVPWAGGVLVADALVGVGAGAWHFCTRDAE